MEMCCFPTTSFLPPKYVLQNLSENAWDAKLWDNKEDFYRKMELLNHHIHLPN